MLRITEERKNIEKSEYCELDDIRYEQFNLCGDLQRMNQSAPDLVTSTKIKWKRKYKNNQNNKC